MAKSTHIYNLVAVNGEYTSNGQTKKRYITCGKVFRNDQGQIAIKVESLPAGNQWNGWFSLYKPETQPAAPAAPATPAPPQSSAAEDDDDIPF